MASKYLSLADRTGEIAFAVIMVIIINGYVALSQLNTGFLYIVAVNLGACTSWGIIDGLIYAISSSIARNSIQRKLLMLKTAVNQQSLLQTVKNSLDDTFLRDFDDKGKEAIAKEIINQVPNANLEKTQIITKEEALGWLSIIGIYLAVGFLLALPFLVLQNKILAWLVSNIAGTSLLFWYGTQLGRVAGKNRWLFGLLLAAISILFLALSYFAYAR